MFEQFAHHQVLFGLKVPDFDPLPTLPLQFFNQNLNEVQHIAIQHAISARHACLIHGPPGTGKTTTLVEIIRQLVLEGKKLLVCAPSNIAVDNIIERMPTQIRIIRLGNASRILPHLQHVSLDVRVKTCDQGSIVNDLRKEMDETLLNAQKTKSRTARRDIYKSHRELKKDLRVRESKLTGELMQSSQVIFSTLSGAGSKKLTQLRNPLSSNAEPYFDVVLIDEASQAIEAECWFLIYFCVDWCGGWF